MTKNYKKLWKKEIEEDEFSTFTEVIPNNCSIRNALNSILHELFPYLKFAMENHHSQKLISFLEEVKAFSGEEGYFHINPESWNSIAPYIDIFKSQA